MLELVKKIGEGAFASVYLTTSSDPKKQVVVKRMTKKRPNQRFMEEYTIHNGLCQNGGHANIIGIFGAKSDDDFHDIYLEYAEGGDMFDRIGSGMTQHEARPFFRQLLRGIWFIHKNDIAHLDIKPENLLIMGNDILKIADFGSAAKFRHNGLEVFIHKSSGTPHYTAPEVSAGQSYRGQPVDVWSAGVTLMVMLLGMLLWDRADNTSNVYREWIQGKNLTKRPWSKMGRKTVSLLQKMVQLDPEHRPTIEEIEMDPWLCLDSKTVKKSKDSKKLGCNDMNDKENMTQ